MGMVEEMASAFWRLRRNWAIENHLLRRYETRIHVMYQRALYNLLILRSARNRSEPKKSRVSNISRDFDEPNEPNEPKVA